MTALAVMLICLTLAATAAQVVLGARKLQLVAAAARRRR